MANIEGRNGGNMPSKKLLVSFFNKIEKGTAGEFHVINGTIVKKSKVTCPICLAKGRTQVTWNNEIPMGGHCSICDSQFGVVYAEQ